jgi:hypothetical protein
VIVPAGLADKPGRPTAVPATAGQHVVEGDAVWFVPRFAFFAGRTYSVFVHRSIMGADEDRTHFDVDEFDEWTLSLPANRGEATTRVAAVYPSGPELPRNALRLYVHFSAPMSAGLAATHIKLLDAQDAIPIEHAFFSMEPELWDRERRRLTVLFDPARIKRGLAPHEEAGYPLRIGTLVDMVIDVGFLDAGGRPLMSGHSRRYGVCDDVRATVDPARWRLSAPAAGTTSPLVVAFDRAMDHALASRCLSVVDANRLTVRGSGRCGPAERTWEFTPEGPWRRGHHSVVVDPILEDLAGNSVTRVFDRDLVAPTAGWVRRTVVDFDLI